MGRISVIQDKVALDFQEAVVQAMTKLAEDPRVLFVGQQVAYPGHAMYESLKHIPEEKRIEFPVAEEFQMGFCTGLALAGFVPVACYPRMDFLVLAMNQLVNHLDKLEAMSRGEFHPKVIIRTMKGTTKPLDPGPQHSQDHTAAFRLMLTNIDVVDLSDPGDAMMIYRNALRDHRSIMVVESPPGRR